MSIDVKTKSVLKGGEWLVKESSAFEMFIPEDFSEEQLMIRDMCNQFLDTEVVPLLDRIDALEPGLMRSLVEKAGEQGLLSVSFPEEYGGLGKDFVTSTIVNEYLGAGHSFSVAIAAHTGIGTLPILYFGTAEQKQKYIPKLISGEWVGAYGLTEPNSGSDALGAKTSAKLSGDGKYYLLNGQKCWITNGGFADVYTVFAKVDGDKFTGFIVERGTEGFTQGPEEHKMGIKGSSTVQLYFQDCKVPVENVLGEIGKGHRIAFNILNIGRLKLCAAAAGGARRAVTTSVRYAVTREQFKQPISNFGAIKHKLAEMAIRVFVAESALYRTANWIDEKEKELVNAGKAFNEALLGAAEEYAIECAALKVYGSEVLDFVVDEGVQIHGGNGFSAEYEISRAYRDSRINRIYEGTNEINRLLILDMTLKRAMQGRLNLMGPATEVQKELVSIPDFGADDEAAFANEKKLVANLKKAILMTPVGLLLPVRIGTGGRRNPCPSGQAGIHRSVIRFSMQLNISKNIEELSWRVAEWMVDCIHEVLQKQDRFTITLSGGGTPKKLYQLLASDEFKNKIDWRKLHVFWGDERYVPFMDDRNNAKMAFDTLLDHVPVPKSQIHIMRTDIDAEVSADEYEKILKDYFPQAASHKPQATSQDLNHDSHLASDVSRPTTFDLVLLGLGDNAHTLSLFPGEEIIHEKNDWVKSVFIKEVNMQRITLTAPIVNQASRIAFMVTGQDKADAVSHVLLNDYIPDLYPAQVIKPVNGEMHWFLDEAAAMRLKK